MARLTLRDRLLVLRRRRSRELAAARQDRCRDARSWSHMPAKCGWRALEAEAMQASASTAAAIAAFRYRIYGREITIAVYSADRQAAAAVLSPLAGRAAGAKTD